VNRLRRDPGFTDHVPPNGFLNRKLGQSDFALAPRDDAWSINCVPLFPPAPGAPTPSALLLLSLVAVIVARAGETSRPEIEKLVLADMTWRAVDIATERFADESWRERWVIEGQAELRATGGKLIANAETATLWWRTPLPKNVLVEMEAGVDAPAERNAANLNLFLHARELDGRPYAFGRSGEYADYHKIPNYIVTFTGGTQPGWSRLRRDPGFNLLSEEKSTRAEVGRSYRMRVAVADGHIRYWLDGRLIHEAHDSDALPGGHFALRTWRSRVWWRNIRFAPLERIPERGGAVGESPTR
jgi:hypothetical protein